MPFEIEIRPLAILEIIEAYDWYESRKEGLGMDFLNELEAFQLILNRNPETFGFYDKPVRQRHTKKIPLRCCLRGG